MRIGVCEFWRGYESHLGPLRVEHTIRSSGCLSLDPLRHRSPDFSQTWKLSKSRTRELVRPGQTVWSDQCNPAVVFVFNMVV